MSFRSVKEVSSSFGISTRRVRQMLIDGTLKGEKNGREWLVFFPYQITQGTRGPLITFLKNKAFRPTLSRNGLKPSGNNKIKGV